jgi:hypothetical protein
MMLAQIFSLRTLVVILWAGTFWLTVPCESCAYEEGPRPIIYGITSGNGFASRDLLAAIRPLSKTVWTRLVFDEGILADDYKASTKAIHDISPVMGLVADSSTMKSYSVSEHRQRYKSYLDKLSGFVDLWEIGNEVNGSWTGSTAEVVLKITDAFNLVKSRHEKTALTLYFNTPCDPYSEREMFTWAKANIKSPMKEQLDYVWISYYEDDCPGPDPDWNDVFKKLGEIFPKSKLGFGEVGTNIADRKAWVLNQYYSLSQPGRITHPRFVGGYFYWYFFEDMVPETKPLWSVFNNLLKSLP